MRRWHSSGAGICIDAGRVCVVELEESRGVVRVTHAAEVEFKTDTGDPASESAAVSQAVNSALQKSGIRPGRPMAAAVACKDSITRYFELPPIPKKEWGNAVRFEAQKFLPLNLRDLSFSFEASADAAQKKVLVTFLAAKKEIIARHLALLANCGLAINYLEGIPLSLLRAQARLKKNPPGEICALIDLQKNGGMSLLIMRGGHLLMLRDTTLITAADSEGQAAALPTFEAFLIEIRLTLNYFSKNFKDQEIKRALFMPTAEECFKGWPERLQNEFGIASQTADWRPLLGDRGSVSAALVAAAGLALKEIAGVKNDKMNLIQKSEQPAPKTAEALGPLITEAEKKPLQKAAATGIVLVAALLFAAHLFLGQKIRRQENALMSIRTSHTQTAGIVSPSADAGQLNQAETDLAVKLGFWSSLIDQRVYLTSKLSALAAATPDPIRLMSLEFSDKESKEGKSEPLMKIEAIVLPGEDGGELEAANAFVSRLKENVEFMAGFKEVKIASLTKSTIDKMPVTNFTIECAAAKKTGG